MEYTIPRGLRDIAPEEAASAEIVREAFFDTCRLFDYKVMEPSSLEMLETLEAKSGPAIRDEIYFFKDKSGRDLGLRFDLTVGMTRYVASRRELGLPVRLGAYSSVWRYDEPQYGRYRWFYQWDIELFGPSNPEADAEIIEFTSTLFRKVGTKSTISMGSRKVIETFVRNQLKILEEKKILDILRAIDKLSKKTLDEIAKEYHMSISKNDLDRVAEFVSIRGDPSSVASSISGYGIDGSNLLKIADSLSSRGIRGVELNLSIARGLDYYTDMVFEAYHESNPRLGALCGGGRYDSLPSIYGRPDLGATGVAGGIERALLTFSQKLENESRFFVAPIGERPEIRSKAIEIAAALRRDGHAAQSEISGRSLRKIMENQSSAGTKAIVIVGERELENGKVRIKWMSTGDEEEVRIEDVGSVLASA